jgi:hypothetical protein
MQSDNSVTISKNDIIERIKKLTTIIKFESDQIYNEPSKFENIMHISTLTRYILELDHLSTRCVSDSLPYDKYSAIIQRIDDEILKNPINSDNTKFVVPVPIPIPVPFSLDYYKRIAEIKGIKIDNVKDIVKNAHLFDQNDLTKAMDLDSEYFARLGIRLILGYYLPKFKTSFHGTHSSVILIGMLLGIPARILTSHVNISTYKQVKELLNEYTEKNTIDPIKFIPLIDSTSNDIMQQFIIKKFTYKQLIEHKCPLIKNDGGIVGDLIDIVDEFALSK